MFNAQLHDGLVDFLLSDAGKLRAVSQCGSVKAKMAGCLTLAAAFFSYSVPCQLTAVRRAYSFFSRASLSTLIPSIASAYIFLSSPFSFSSALSRLASSTSIIPNFFAPAVQRGYRDLLLLAELFLAQVTRVTFTQEEDDFFGLVSFLSVHFCRIWL
jgi:hypothetical protein